MWKLTLSLPQSAYELHETITSSLWTLATSNQSSVLLLSTKMLSFSGRLLLIITVISGITNFWCFSFVLPKACVAKINSMCSVFLWRGNLEAHNSARVSWSVVVKTKVEGGLGVKDLLFWNKAWCLRLIWLMFFRPDLVWVSWFKEVILKGSLSNYWTTKPSQTFFPGWQINYLS